MSENHPDVQVSTWPNEAHVWQRVSMKYAWADLALNVILTLIVVTVFVLIVVFADEKPPPLVIAIFAAVTVGLLLSAAFAFRRVRAIGYILREDDLLFRKGIMFERVVAVVDKAVRHGVGTPFVGFDQRAERHPVAGSSPHQGLGLFKSRRVHRSVFGIHLARAFIHPWPLTNSRLDTSRT